MPKRLLMAGLVMAAVCQVAPGFQSGKGSKTAPDFVSLGSEMRGYIERYAADRGSVTRSLGERFGPERGGLVQAPAIDFWPGRSRRLREFYREWLDRIGRVEFEALSMDGRIDYVLFKNHLERELRVLDADDRRFAEISALLPFAQAILDLDEARRGMQPVDAAKAAAGLSHLSRRIEEQRKALEAQLRPAGRSGPGEEARIKKPIANRAGMAAIALRNTLRNWFDFYNGYDPLFTWWASEPYQATDRSLQAYASFLRERIAGVRPASPGDGEAAGDPATRGRAGPSGRFGSGQGPAPAIPAPAPGDEGDIIGDPIGRDALLSELAAELIPYTPEELISIAHQEFAWCENEMKRASRDLGYGDDWHKALEHVKNLYVPPGKQPELIRDLAREAIEFVEKRDLVTIPPLAKETWRMQMMSPQRQLVNPFFTGGEVISVSYPTNTMTHEQKMMSMRGNNLHFPRATVHHELIPGHHLQGFMAARYRPYRSLFSTPFQGEGWALYWEMLLWDLGFPKTPEDRIGFLFWRMQRCARIIFSLSFHLEKMTPQEAIEFLVTRVGNERDNATAEVRRSFATSYPPLYQAAYMLGGLQIRALHRELVSSGKMTNRAFHDAILQQNRIPIEMVRAALTNQQLRRDFTTSWKFYGPKP